MMLIEVTLCPDIYDPVCYQYNSEIIYLYTYYVAYSVDSTERISLYRFPYCAPDNRWPPLITGPNQRNKLWAETHHRSPWAQTPCVNQACTAFPDHIGSVLSQTCSAVWCPHSPRWRILETFLLYTRCCICLSERRRRLFPRELLLLYIRPYRGTFSSRRRWSGTLPRLVLLQRGGRVQCFHQSALLKGRR